MTRPVLLAPPEHRWECPRCDFTDVTRQHGPHTRMHPCRGLGGLTAPMVPAGTRAKVEVVEREDYIGRDLVRLHEGRPVMNVTVTRDDGQDAVVFAPTATNRE
ncbi:MAG: hypothetical protein AB7W59_02170 [Acidimicrobiia bacterium]